MGSQPRTPAGAPGVLNSSWMPGLLASVSILENTESKPREPERAWGSKIRPGAPEYVPPEPSAHRDIPQNALSQDAPQTLGQAPGSKNALQPTSLRW